MNQLILGDNLEITQKMGSESIDAFPYLKNKFNSVGFMKKYFVLLFLILFCSCKPDTPIVPTTVKIHVYFAAQTPGFSQYNKSGEVTLTITKGITYTDSISVSQNEKWSIKVIYYNSLTDHKISIYGYNIDGPSVIDIKNNNFTCSGFDSYLSPGIVNGFVEELK